MADIDRRIEAFDALENRCKGERVRPLILVHRIPGDLFGNLIDAIWAYLAAAARPEKPQDLMEAYDNGEIYAVTPAGMVVPKSTSWLEYNKVFRSFADVVENMGISDLIETWHVPLNVRFKSSAATDSINRPHATEKPHSDSWAGESTESVTLHLPLLGDTERNYLKLFYPKEFREDWLGSHNDYEDGHRILPFYEEVDYKIRCGSVCMIDFATLHSSTRLPGCGWRVSIDTTFVLKKRDMAERIHERRETERMNPEMMRKIGSSHLFYFPCPPDAQVNVPGFKHPTELVIKSVA